MTTDRPLGNNDDGDVWALIPWYVNGTLTEEEAARVRARLASCERCRREVAEQSRLAQAIARQQTSDVSLERDWSQFRKELTAADRHQPRQRPGAAARPRSRRRFLAPAGLAAAAAIGTVMIGQQSSMVANNKHQDRRDPTYVTVTDPAKGLVMLRVQATPTVDAVVLQAIFDENALTLVDGPSSGAIYTLSAKTRDEAASAAAALTASEHIQMVIIGGGE